MPTSTPWDYFRENLHYADSPLKFLALVAVTLIILHFYLGRWHLALLIGFGALAVLKPEIRQSRLVRIGAAVYVLTYATLRVFGAFVTDNPLGPGMLFAFSTPIAFLLMLIGSVQTFVKRDTGIGKDVSALVAAAKKTSRLWPDDGSLREIDEVARHGPQAGPSLVGLLRFESDEQLADETWSPAVEQQAALALCRIFGETPAAGRTVYDVRSTSAENARVKPFWTARVAR